MFGRPIFKPISPYDDHPGQITRPYDYGQHQGVLGHHPEVGLAGEGAAHPGPDSPRTLGLVPDYGQVADPYSEIGFPMQYNPYM